MFGIFSGSYTTEIDLSYILLKIRQCHENKIKEKYFTYINDCLLAGSLINFFTACINVLYCPGNTLIIDHCTSVNT